MKHFSINWDFHRNIFDGLSSLQQNGEFVDMTLAADGHFVKVHQIVLALASPYIKEIIASTNCQHPVIILNKISYQTLCSLLEYVYTGEAVVAVENLNELIAAGKELHIKGIDKMTVSGHSTTTSEDKHYVYNTSAPVKYDYDRSNQNDIETFDSVIESHNDTQDLDENEDESFDYSVTETAPSNVIHNVEPAINTGSLLQYTVSNQGSLQMILNRFMYYLKYTKRNNVRQWRCVDYLNKCKCPAHVMTKGDVVLKRIGAHKHMHHDKRILKKLRCGAIFTALNDAQREGEIKKSRLAEAETEIETVVVQNELEDDTEMTMDKTDAIIITTQEELE